MTAPAPHFNSVNHLNGDVAQRPSAFWQALAEADEEVALLDQARELQCRVQELEAENAELRAALAKRDKKIERLEARGVPWQM